MTSNEIADIIINDLVRRNFPIFLTSFYGHGIAEADVFAINRNGYIYEFEIKRSRSDFFADFRNKPAKHRDMQSGDAIKIYDKWVKGKRTEDKYEIIKLPNRYFFVCEDGLLTLSDIPKYAGLIHIRNGQLYEIKNAPLLHKNKANSLIYERVATVLSQRIIYGCSYYTHRMNKHNQ